MQYGVIGNASLGPSIIEPGAIKAPEPISRAKMLIQHDTERSVGYLQSLETEGDLERGTFYIPASTEGDEALLKAGNGTRDGLSIGIAIEKYHFDSEGVLHVTAARLNEVSLVTIPAFENARVNDVAAQQEENNMTVQKLREAADTEQKTLEAAQETPPALEPQAPAPFVAAAAGPAMDLSAAARTTLEHLQAGGSPSTLRAALKDIVPADDAGAGVIRPQFVDELWQASLTERPLIDSITKAKLNGLKVYGWQFDLTTSLGVDKYAGNKTAIPSGNVKTKPIDTTAQRFAGGWDIDRAYIDLGEPGFIETVYRKAVDEYKQKTESYVSTELKAKATAVPEQASITAALTELGVRAAGLGANLSFIQFDPLSWAEFVALKADQVPWWLRQQGQVNLGTVSGSAGGMSFSVNRELDARQMMAGDRRAATWYEVDPPIRVNAVDLANGGIDLGLFGYGAVLVNDARALFKTTIKAPAGSTPPAGGGALG
ncbi:MAG: HK97 family phage prohead protease [Renibacterium salmoninarum]|nr:HK97 family phage prohead protease [Renibacterium salmoninarum]